MQAAQPDVRFSGESPERQTSPIAHIGNFVWNWCIRLRILFYVLVPMALFVAQRGYHYGEKKNPFQYFTEHPIEMVTIYLAVAAIGFATHHDWKLEEQTEAGRRQLRTLQQLEDSMSVQLRELNRGVGELNRLEKSLSTHRTGPFPKYLHEIGQFARTARYLDIIVDCLDFGSFFAPAVHKEVHNAIRNAALESLTVRILVCGGKPEPLTGPSGQGLDKYKKAPIYLAEYGKALREDSGFGRFVELVGKPDDPAVKYFEESWLPIGVKLTPEVIAECLKICSGKRELNMEDCGTAMFTALLQLRQLWFAADLWLGARGKIEIRSQEEREPMFMWVKYLNEAKEDRDSRDDALFTFANAARGPHQLGYSTHDPDLVTTFRLIFEEKWDWAVKQPPQRWLEYLRSFGGIRSMSASASGGTQEAMF